MFKHPKHPPSYGLDDDDDDDEIYTYPRIPSGELTNVELCSLPGELVPGVVIADAREHGGTSRHAHQPLYHACRVLSRRTRQRPTLTARLHRLTHTCAHQPTNTHCADDEFLT